MLRCAGGFVPAVVFVIAVLLIVPLGTVFEFDRDEGLNLMKAALLKEGMPLYSAIWSDQPPLLTTALAGLFKVTGNSVGAARGLMLAVSAIGLLSIACILRMTAGWVAAFAGVGLLALSNEYVRLSVAVMIGLPALSLALAAIALALAGARRGSWSLIVFSGVVMGVSMQTKLFTFMAVPWVLLLIGLTFRRPDDGAKRQAARSFGAVGAWVGGFAVVFVGVGLYFGSLNYELLIHSHVRDKVEAAQHRPTAQMLREFAKWDWEHHLLAGVGLIGAVARRRWVRLLPAAWFATAVAVMSNHRPVWDDHYVLFSIPLSWLAAYAVADAIELLRPRARTRGAFERAGAKRPGSARSSARDLLRRPILLRIAAALPAVALLACVAWRVPAKAQRWDVRKMPHTDLSGSAKVVREMQKRGTPTGWVFTDRPIYAFYAGRRVPPEVAVISAKRFHSEALTRADLIALVKRYGPEQIVLARFLRTDMAFRFWLLITYSKEVEDRGVMLFEPRGRK